MDREAFDKLSQADRQWLIVELLTGIMGRVDLATEILLSEIADEGFPEPQGNA